MKKERIQKGDSKKIKIRRRTLSEKKTECSEHQPWIRFRSFFSTKFPLLISRFVIISLGSILSPSFTEFCWILLDFSGFSWILLGLTACCGLSRCHFRFSLQLGPIYLTEILQFVFISPGSILSLSFTEFCRILPSIVGFYWVLLIAVIFQGATSVLVFNRDLFI